MNRKQVIRKVVLLLFWLLVIVGLSSLLIAANKRQSEHLCRKLVIEIKGSGEKFYIQEADIKRMVEKAAKGKIINSPVKAIDLARIEASLEKHEWIKNAELYFNNREVLNIFIEERVPVARIFTAAGKSFYIDSSGQKMSVLEHLVTRVPVFTGFSANKKWHSKDSALLQDVKKLGWFVYNNEFWNAQIGQIDITSERKFELIPVIGYHVIRIGNAENIEDKFSRLFLFYKKVLIHTGFNKYRSLDIQYSGQVIAVKNEPVSEIDSIQLQKNIEELMKQNSLLQSEQLTDAGTKPIYQPPSVQKDSVSVKTNPTPAFENHPDPLKKQQLSNTGNTRKVNITKKDERKLSGQSVKPKALMQRKA